MKKGLYFLIFIALVVFSKPCAERGLGFYLRWKAKVDYNLDLSFRSLFVTGTKIEIKKLTFNKDEIEGFVDQANFYFHFDFSKLSFFPELGLKKPKIYLKKAISLKSGGIRRRLPVSIKEGMLFVGEINTPLTFSYKASDKSFEGFFEEGRAYAKIDDERVIFSFEKMSLSRLLLYARFFSYVDPNLSIEGIGDGSIIFPFSSEKLFADLHLKDFAFKKNNLLIETKSLSFKLRGYFDLEKTIWENNKKFNTFLSLSDAKISSKENPWEINSLNGFFFLDSLVKFQSEFSAIAENGKKTIPLLLEGKKGDKVSCYLDFLKTKSSEDARASFTQLDTSFLFEVKKMCPEKKKIFDLVLSEVFPKENIEQLQGIIDTKFELLIDKGKLNTICLHHFYGENLILQKEEMKASLEKILALGNYSVCENLLTDGCLKLTQGKINYKNMQVDPLNIDLMVKDRMFGTSTATSSINGVKAVAKFEGKLPFFTSNIEIDGDIAALCRQTLLQDQDSVNKESDNLLCKYLSKIHLNINKKEEGIFYTGQMDSAKDRVMVFAKTKDFIYWPDDLWKSLHFFECECEHFDLSSLNAFFPSLSFGGIVAGNVDWDNNDFSIKMNLEQFSLKNHLFSLEFQEKISLEQGRFSPVSEKISFTFPFQKGVFHLENPDLSFENIEGTLFFEDRLFTFDLTKGQGEGFSMKGKAFFDPRGRIDLDLKQIKGSLSDTHKILDKLEIPATILQDMQGEIQANSFVYSLVNDLSPASFFSIDGDLKSISGKISEAIGFQNLKGAFSFDTNSETLSLKDMTTSLKVQGEEDLVVKVESLTKKNDELTFDFSIDQSFLELARLKGSAHSYNGIYFSFDEISHFYGNNLKNFSCKIFENHLEEFSLQSNLNLTKKKMQLLQNLLGFKTSLPMDAKLDLSANFNGNEGKLKLKGKELSLFDQSFNDLNIEIEKHAGDWKINSAYLDDITFVASSKNSHLDFQVKYLDESVLSLSLEMENLEKWKIDSFKYLRKKPNVFLSGKGSIVMDLFQDHPFSIDCDLSLSDSNRIEQYFFRNSTPLNMKFSLKDQLLIGGLDLFVSKNKAKEPTHIKTKIVHVDLTEKKLNSETIALSIPKEFHFGKQLINKDLGVVDLTFDVAADLEKIDLHIKNGFFQEDLSFEKKQFKNLKVRYDQNTLALEGIYFFDRTPVLFQADVFLDQEVKGSLTLFEPEKKVQDPLSIYWHFNNAFVIDHLSGEFSGIEAEFCHKDAGLLIGRANIDFSKFSPFLGKRLKEVIVDGLEMKEGYFLKGKLSYDPKGLVPQTFSGHITGKNFSFFGYELQTLFSKINWSDKGLFIDHLKMSDEGGMLHIDKLYFEKKNQSTFLNIPKITFEDIRPSLLKQAGFSKSTNKTSTIAAQKEKKKELDPPELDPLIIKQVTIEDLYGDIEDDSTITGKGSLNFINSFNRGKKNLFDLPSEVIGKIFGLDLELLIPVCGSLDFKIQDQKLLFTDLKDTYSENERSQFFLFEKMTPYIDFDSNLHVYIKMKQFVLFKVTEQLIISLSGSIYDPKIALENKNQFND